jgi:hypothetical protein
LIMLTDSDIMSIIPFWLGVIFLIIEISEL